MMVINMHVRGVKVKKRIICYFENTLAKISLQISYIFSFTFGSSIFSINDWLLYDNSLITI